MKIFQLNIWGGRLMRNILQVIDHEDPDIICLQEVCSSPDGEIMFDGDNLQILEKKLSEYHFYYAPTCDFDAEELDVFFGNLIISRYPIKNKNTIFTSLEHVKGLKIRSDDYNVRNFQHAVIDTPDGHLNVINHHGYHVSGHKDGNDETMRQMKMISDYIEELSGPVILTGDFNLAPESESLSGLNDLLNNLCITHNITNTRNQFAKRDMEVCDFIFVDKKTDVKSFTVLDDLISDHAALTVTF